MPQTPYFELARSNPSFLVLSLNFFHSVRQTVDEVLDWILDHVFIVKRVRKQPFRAWILNSSSAVHASMPKAGTVI